jgi:hypothetical protein
LISRHGPSSQALAFSSAHPFAFLLSCGSSDGKIAGYIVPEEAVSNDPRTNHVLQSNLSSFKAFRLPADTAFGYSLSRLMKQIPPAALIAVSFKCSF